jgi:mono/diheme cytochrome c family protein
VTLSVRRFGLAAFAVTAAVALLSAGTRASPRVDGSFTATQAAAGALLYAADCSRCHGVDLRHGSAPPLAGPAIAGRWPVKTLYAFVSKQMPADARGSLRPEAYAAVVAFLLRQNGHPPGRAPLTRATAAKIEEKL